jgi:cytochrome c biogenesis protein CcmG/thiol:disulfide interchange protein DsbE
MSDEADEPLTGDAPQMAAETAPGPPRRTLIGPFTARQVALANAVVVGTALVLFLVTRPLVASNSPPTAIDLGTAFYQISAKTQGLDLGQRAPELAGDDNGVLTQLMDLDGQAVTLASLKGHPVWINFWATWCPPCQRETPVLRDAYKAHEGQGLVLLAIDVQEDAATVRQYATTYGLTYRIGLDTTGTIFHAYRIYGLPSHYFIDRNGVIRGRYFGPLTRDQVEQQLAVILQP